ncbi:adenosylcobinamide-phosphate synthase CbiB [Microaerobacter geothermalis]|uniref:adenosylcobinamide-phosphate synthase CbiB n=1 Tax=Microaerobacter geothermalis TaxID=674972 RepID=UPI001F179152|nr:adenosylcobinamide-phosphate synthase CbiB [Microaerobacter geothermalis]MCF6093096.1 adenosylcobinamide-phosphate synthase CbiB [Microaerobacter geothermalis]
MTLAFMIAGAYFIDIIIGDPRNFPHPVVYIGKSITFLERMIRRIFKREVYLKYAGMLFPIIIAGGSYFIVYLLLKALSMAHPILSWIMEIWLISTTIAVKGLKDVGLKIYVCLLNKDVIEARRTLSMVVGRDTESLDEKEISRGAVETVAENMVDAIISPLFYAMIGGAPLAMAYRAANTLDSMVGYKNEQYRNLGWASARFDDVLNFLPARLTFLLIVLASWIKGYNYSNAWKITLRDARKHPSPNSGFPEAAVAGALGIQLGGTNYYQGIASHRAKMGDLLRTIQPDDIVKCVKLMILVSLIFILVVVVFLLLICKL